MSHAAAWMCVALRGLAGKQPRQCAIAAHRTLAIHGRGHMQLAVGDWDAALASFAFVRVVHCAVAGRVGAESTVLPDALSLLTHS